MDFCFKKPEQKLPHLEVHFFEIGFLKTQWIAMRPYLSKYL
jgi:hypothetical protein